MTAPRVLQIAKYFYPYKGGIEVVTQVLSDGLLRHGITADVYCLDHGRNTPAPDQPYRVIRKQAEVKYKTRALSLSYVADLGRTLTSYDVALVHMPNPLAVLALWLSGWRGRIVLFWHSDIVSYPTIAKLFTPWDRWLINRAEAVIVPTDVHATASRHAVVLAPRAVTIPLGITPLVASETTDRITVIQQAIAGRPMVLGVGRLVPYKGFQHLIAAVRNIPTDAVVCLCGDGPERLALEAQIAAAGISDRVIMTGLVQDAEVSALMHLCRVLVLPSVNRTEMFGLVQVEAMSLGKPVVSTQVPGSGVSLVNRNGETGFTVPVGDDVALGAAITQLLTDTQTYARLSVGAQRVYAAEYTAERMVERVAAVLQGQS
jgi:rhamnosyl/mannosyltransferase